MRRRYRTFQPRTYNTSGSMLEGVQFFLLVSLLLGAASGNPLNAKDAETCTGLCASCDGTATFEDERCECLVPEGSKLGLECLERVNRKIENVDRDSSSADHDIAERSPRCSLFNHRARLGATDAARVARYFMNGGPLAGSSLLGRSSPDCSSSFNDQITGDPNNAIEHVAVPIATSPLVGASGSSDCANAPYQPIVSTQWLPNYGMGYNRMVGAYQPFRGGYYPRDLIAAVPHMVLEIPKTLMRATHIPAHRHYHQHHHPGLLGASQHSPLLSNLASSTHGLLQRLDNMVSPYTREHNHGNILSSPHAENAPCAHSAQSPYQRSNMIVAPRIPPAHPPNPALLRQVLAHQNSLLEALSSQLGSYRSQTAAPRIPAHHTLGAPGLTGRCYCPENGESSMVGAPNPNGSESLATTSPKEANASKANDARNETKESDDKTIVGAKNPADKEETAEGKLVQKVKRESRLSSSPRNKRGDLKNL